MRYTTLLERTVDEWEDGYGVVQIVTPDSADRNELRFCYYTDGEFVNRDVQYAVGVWRRDGRRRVEYTPDPTRTAKMADAETFVTERVDLVGVKLSHDLSEGDNPLYLVGDGSERVDHFAVHTRESALNRDLAVAEYGDLLGFENALVLWNDDEGAYNVVVDGETVVDRLAR